MPRPHTHPLCSDELNSFTRMAEGCDMMEEVYKWLIESFDSRDGGLTADGFVECYYYMYAECARLECSAVPVLAG